MTASAEVDRLGKGENSFSSFTSVCFVLFRLIFPAHCRLLEKKKKKKGCGQANKKSFSSSDLV